MIEELQQTMNKDTKMAKASDQQASIPFLSECADTNTFVNQNTFTDDENAYVDIADTSNSLFEKSPETSQATKTTTASSSSKTPFLSKYSKWCSNVLGKRRRISTNSTSSTVTSTAESNITDKVDKIANDVLSVKTEVMNLNVKLENFKLADRSDTEPTTKTDNLWEAKKTLIRVSKNLSEICVLCPELHCSESQGLVTCENCFNDDDVGTVGKLHYDFSLGTNFKNSNEPIPRQFLNLKNNIIKHLESAAHSKNSSEKALLSKQKTKFLARNSKVGMVLGRQAYNVLVKSDSYLIYENNVAILAASGVDVGNLNHSEKFVSEFGKSVHTELMNQMQTFLNTPLPATGRPAPISVIADKITPNRRTMQIVGFYGFVAGKFQSLVSGTPPLLGEDGYDVTRTLRDGLESLNISQADLRKRLVGGAFDGEYVHLGVGSHLLDSLLVPKNPDDRDWYTFQWDPAHIVELAEADAKNKDKDVQDTLGIISKVSKSFSYGKSYRMLMEEASLPDEMEIATNLPKKKERARTPGHFSETRFATYSSEVLKKWLHNYKYYYRMMNREQNDKNDKIDNAPFLFSCAGLNDVYEIVGKLSNAIQKHDVTVWEISTIIETYTSTLNQMAENVISSEPDENLFPCLSKIFKEVSETGEFASCPILTKKYTSHGTRGHFRKPQASTESYEEALKAASKSIQSFTSDLVSNLKSRFEKEEGVNGVLITAANLFDVRKIVNYDNLDDIKRDLAHYAALAKSSGNLDFQVKDEELLAEYEIFSKRVKDIAPNYIYVSKNPKPQSSTNQPPKNKRYRQLDLYKKMLETPELYKDIARILHLALCSLSRTHCEAIVEGMGSVLGQNMRNRKSLDPKTVERETIIRWQGPNASTEESTELIKRSLDRHFQGRSNWHFCATSDSAKYLSVSEVLTRVKKDSEKKIKIPFK